LPPRPAHIPHNIERTSLQRIARGGWFPATSLLPAQRRTISKMLAKGWIERRSDGALYQITAAGLAALKMQIPVSQNER
jgi:hypothetical protein